MNIIEALTLAKEKGVRVRPVAWRILDDRHIAVLSCSGLMQIHGDGWQCRQNLALDELLGEWEVVP